MRQILSKDAENIPLKFPRVYWFNKYKVGLGDYGVALIKDGMETTDQQDLQTRSKSKFRIVVISKEKDSVTVQGRKLELTKYEYQGQSGMDWVLSTFTQIESETIPSVLSSIEILEAVITDRHADGRPWNVYLLKPAASSREITGFLENGSRKLEIRMANYAGEDSDQEMDSEDAIARRFELVENGKSLAAGTNENGRSIWLEPDLDPHSRSIFVATCLLLHTQTLWLP